MNFKGINQDLNISHLTVKDGGLYFYGKNIVISEHLGSIVNELGDNFLQQIDAEYSNAKIIGITKIEDVFIIFSIIKDTYEENFDDSFGTSVIGIFYQDIYKEVENIRLYDWGFSTYFPIQAKAHKSNQEELIVAFTDNFNLPRIVNIGKKANLTLIANNVNETFVFPTTTLGNIELSYSNSGGSLLSGMYFASYQYEDSQGNTSAVNNISNGYWIAKDNSSTTETQYNGDIANTPTNKSLKLVIDDLDTNYSFIILYIIKVLDGITSVIKLEKLPISGDILNFTYTGNETFYDATIQEVLIPPAQYLKARTITSHEGSLYLGNLEQEEEPNLQPFLNYTVINFVSELIDLDVLENSQKINNKRGFMHDEAYAFYARFYKNGVPTRAYHLPGRPSLTNETIEVDGIPFYVKNDTSFSGGLSNMGFWENQNENYPLEGGFPNDSIFVNTKIRHHKFPSMANCKKFLYNNEAEYGKSKIDILGIEVIFPQDLPFAYDSYEILYAKRELNNTTNLGTDLLMYAALPENNSRNLIWTSAGNWSLRADQAGSGDWGDFMTNDTHIRLHNFDMLLDNIAELPTYIKGIFKLRKPNLNASFEDEGKEGGAILVSGDSNSNNSDDVFNEKNVVIIDYSSNNTSVTLDERVSNINELEYVYNNLASARYFNHSAEKAIIGKLETVFPLVYSRMITRSPNENTGSIFTSETNFEETYLISLHYLKTDLYVNFYNQQLASTGKLIPMGISSPIFGGDTYINYNSFLTTTVLDSDNKDRAKANDSSGVFVYRKFIAESVHHIGLRNENNGEDIFHYYPVSDIPNIVEPLLVALPYNTIGYNKDYTRVNDFVSSNIYNPYDVYDYKFPYRIARSLAQNNEQSNWSWKTWRANDYFEATKEAGEIINLESFNKRLLIHHSNRLYITISNTTLETKAVLVELGSGDLFRIMPDSITGETNYAGTQQTHTPIIFKGGYVFVDSVQGKVFILNNGLSLEEISNTGLKHLFEKNLPTINSTTKTYRETIFAVTSKNNQYALLTIPIQKGKGFVNFDNFLTKEDGNAITILNVTKDFINYYVLTDLLYTDYKEGIWLNLDIVKVIEEIITVDNKYQNLGYSLGYDEMLNRLLVTKNVKAGVYLERTSKIVKNKFNIVVPIVTVNEGECSNSSISANSKGGAGITDFGISNYASESPLVILFNPFSQMDKLEILVDSGNGYEIVATSSVFAEGNYGVTTVDSPQTATYPTTVSYIQTPVQGFDPNSGIGIAAGDISALPFTPFTNLLFNQVRFLDEGGIDAPFETRPANSSDYTPPYNPYYVGSALNNIPNRYTECKADLATIGYDLDSSPSVASIPNGQQLVHVKNIPLGASVIARITGFLNTGWAIEVLEVTKSSTCFETDITYETEQIELESEVYEYNLKPFCFSNTDYINGKLIKPECSLLDSYYHLGLVLDKDNNPKKLLLQENLQGDSLEVIYCCPESAPEITVEWEDPVCITETVAGESKPFSMANGLSLGINEVALINFFDVGQFTTLNPSVNDVIEVTYEYLGVFSTVNKTVVLVEGTQGIRLTPKFAFTGGSQAIGTMAYISVTNLTKGTPIVKGGRINSTEGSGFALTGFSAFRNLITNDGEIFTIPYPATAEEIADIVGVDLDYAQELVEDRVNLDIDNCFEPTLKKSTQTIHTRGEDNVKTFTITGQGIHELEIIPLFNTPTTSYKLEGEDLTLAEIQDSIDFNFVPNSTQTYEIEITTSNYASLSKEAVYIAKYNEQGGASFPYDINVGFGVQLLSKDTFLAFDEFVFVAAISGNGWYANVRVNDTDFVTFPLKTISDLNQAIGLIPTGTTYTIHFYLTEPIVVTISDKPTSLTKQYIAFSDKSIDRKTALYLPSATYNLEFVNPQNLSFKITDGDVAKNDSIWNSLTFKTITEIRNEFTTSFNKTILVQNNTAVYERAFNALLFNSEDPYINVAFDFDYKEFYIPREISELTFDFTNSTVTIREDALNSIKTTVTSLIEIQNWFTLYSVQWAILEIKATLPKTIKLR